MVKMEGYVEREPNPLDILAVWGLEPNQQILAKVKPPKRPPPISVVDPQVIPTSRGFTITPTYGNKVIAWSDLWKVVRPGKEGC